MAFRIKVRFQCPKEQKNDNIKRTFIFEGLNRQQQYVEDQIENPPICQGLK